MWKQAALTFAAVFALDLFYAKYTAAIADKVPGWAAIYAAAVIAFSGYAAINYVNDPWMLLPAMGGAAAGTLLGMRL
jgi:hypothetical protein